VGSTQEVLYISPSNISEMTATLEIVDIVFTSITTPVGVNRYGSTSVLDYDITRASSSEHIYSHMEREQDVFGARAQLDHYPLDMIAANLRASSVVLHWPSMNQLLEEIRTSKPKYVAMQVTTPTFERAENMTRLIHEQFPGVQVIYGGYAPNQGSADVMIRGEGVSKMRELFGEEEREIVQPPMTLEYSVLGIPIGKSGIVLKRVGCENACVFCATSKYFDGCSTALQTPEQIETSVSQYQAAGINEVTMFDENHLRNAVANTRFHKFVRSLPEPINITCFGCMDDVQQYKPEDLFDIGYHIWTGVEDFSENYPQKNDYSKIEDFIKTMHEHGILMICSSFFGDPRQTREDCEKTIDRVIALEPYTIQMNIKTPFEGTKFRDEVEMIDGFRNKEFDGHHFVHKHPEISKLEMEAMQHTAQKRDDFELGPSVIRAMAILYIHCR